MKTRTTCPICESYSLQEKPFGYSFKDRWLRGFECVSCGVIFIHPQPSAEELVEMYSREYFEGDFRCGHAGSYFDDETLEGLANPSLLHRIKKFKPSGKFLEIGCAGGAFLQGAKTAGYVVTGVEFSDDAAEFARDKFKLDIRTGDIFAADFPDNTFDVTFMGDVLEHLPDPLGTLKEIHRITAADGIIVIECPMQTNTLFSRFGFLLFGMIGKKTTVSLPPYHLFEFRTSSITGLMKRAGFEVIAKGEGIISPREVTLRGTGIQKFGKKMFQYPNFLITKIFGSFGDRVEIIARKIS